MEEEYIVPISFENEEEAKKFLKEYNEKSTGEGNGFSTALYVKNYYPYFYWLDVIEVVILKIQNFWKGIWK